MGYISATSSATSSAAAQAARADRGAAPHRLLRSRPREAVAGIDSRSRYQHSSCSPFKAAAREDGKFDTSILTGRGQVRMRAAFFDEASCPHCQGRGQRSPRHAAMPGAGGRGERYCPEDPAASQWRSNPPAARRAGLRLAGRRSVRRRRVRERDIFQRDGEICTRGAVSISQAALGDTCGCPRSTARRRSAFRRNRPAMFRLRDKVVKSVRSPCPGRPVLRVVSKPINITASSANV